MNVDEMEWWWNHSWKVRIACFLVYSWNQFFEKLYLSRSIPRNRRHNDKKPEENVCYGLLMLLPPFICMVCPVLPSCLFKLILNVLDVTNRLSLRRTSLIGKPRLAVSSWCARRRLGARVRAGWRQKSRDEELWGSLLSPNTWMLVNEDPGPARGYRGPLATLPMGGNIDFVGSPADQSKVLNFVVNDVERNTFPTKCKIY